MLCEKQIVMHVCIGLGGGIKSFQRVYYVHVMWRLAAYVALASEVIFGKTVS